MQKNAPEITIDDIARAVAHVSMKMDGAACWAKTQAAMDKARLEGKPGIVEFNQMVMRHMANPYAVHDKVPPVIRF